LQQKGREKIVQKNKMVIYSRLGFSDIFLESKSISRKGNSEENVFKEIC